MSKEKQVKHIHGDPVFLVYIEYDGRKTLKAVFDDFETVQEAWPDVDWGDPESADGPRYAAVDKGVGIWVCTRVEYIQNVETIIIKTSSEIEEE